jgi:hypothetical protein
VWLYSDTVEQDGEPDLAAPGEDHPSCSYVNDKNSANGELVCFLQWVQEQVCGFDTEHRGQSLGSRDFQDGKGIGGVDCGMLTFGGHGHLCPISAFHRTWPHRQPPVRQGGGGFEAIIVTYESLGRQSK